MSLDEANVHFESQSLQHYTIDGNTHRHMQMCIFLLQIAVWSVCTSFFSKSRREGSVGRESIVQAVRDLLRCYFAEGY